MDKITLVFKGERHTPMEQLEEFTTNELIDYVIQLEEEINNREKELMKISIGKSKNKPRQKKEAVKHDQITGDECTTESEEPITFGFSSRDEDE